MSEPTFDDTGDQAPAPASVPTGGYEFTPEALAAAREQLIDQGELAPGTSKDAAADSASLGMRALADGAQPAEVDSGELLRQIQAMQSRVETLEREKRLSTAPDVVKYATALHDHIAAKSLANPVINADPDHGWAPVLKQAAAIRDAAPGAADAGKPGTLPADLAKVSSWVAKHARRFPQIDYSYVIELAEEAGEALARLAA